MELNDSLQRAVRELKEDTEALISLLADLKAEGRPVHPLVVDKGETVARHLVSAMELNATLFELTLYDAERKLRSELDDDFRRQLDALKQLLQMERLR